MARLILTSCVFAVLAFGCTDETKTDAPPTPPVTAAVEPAPAPSEPAAVSEAAYVTFVTGLRREPVEAQRIDDPTGASKKKISNWLMTLYRGEEVTILGVQDTWAKVRASDDSEGWVQKNGLLPVEGAAIATVFEPTKTFNRPDLLALNTSRTLDPAALLFVLKTKDQFSEVNYYGQGTAWVLSEKLNTDAREIAAAKLLAKVRWLKERKDASADEVMKLARAQFSDSKLVGMADDNAAIKTDEAPPAGDNSPAEPPAVAPADDEEN